MPYTAVGDRASLIYNSPGCNPLRRVKWLPALPIAGGLVASALFEVQGGFGGGHGPFDQAIGIIGLPWISWLPWLGISDLANVIWIPAVLNAGVLQLVVFGVRHFMHGRPG